MHDTIKGPYSEGKKTATGWLTYLLSKYNEKVDLSHQFADDWVGEKVPTYTDLCVWLSENPEMGAYVELKTTVSMSVKEIKASVDPYKYPEQVAERRKRCNVSYLRR